MNDEALETYLNIIKTHSLTKTAENMFISQSAVSNRLISLEKELNVKLIDRSPGQKGVVLTQKGEEFGEFAKRHQELNRQIQDWSRGDVTEVLRVASVISLTDYVKGFYRELLGKDHVRGEQLPIDGYHLVVHVWIRNSKGEYLIAQRSANRPTFPLVWECVDGSVIKGEDSLQGALREVKEEVGVDLLPEKGHVILSDIKKIEFGKVVNKIVDVWLFEYDGEVDLSNATTDEVAQVAWMGRSQIKELFDANMFVDTLEYFFTEDDRQ